jgi:hypothetical protein
MEVEIIFDDSMSQQEKLESDEWLKNKVFNGGDEFWEGLTGSCALSFMSEKIKSSIGLIGRESFGFMLDYSSVNTERTLSLRYGEHTGETVTAEIGGNPDPYFKEYCMPKEVAWEVIEYFLKTGEQHPTYIWESAEMPEE